MVGRPPGRAPWFTRRVFLVCFGAASSRPPSGLRLEAQGLFGPAAWSGWTGGVAALETLDEVESAPARHGFETAVNS